MNPIVRKSLEKVPCVKKTYHMIRSGALSTLGHVSPAFLISFRHFLAWGRWPDLAAPVTFDEKLLWLNLFWRHPIKASCGDKFRLRGYVEEHRMAYLLPELFGVYSSAAEIHSETLPDRFVLKCSHGCKWNIFCADKRLLDWEAAAARLDRWMRMDFSKVLGEIHYASMKPRIISEEFLSDGSGLQLPTDYKLFCFNGWPYCTMVAKAREPNGIAQLAFYDRAWRERLPYCVAALNAAGDIPKPDGYDEMLECAERLSATMPFVRVDFYCVNGRARLGEMTFTPGACVSADYMTAEAQRDLGSLITLPPPYRSDEPTRM
jgi:hypothetical protein